MPGPEKAAGNQLLSEARTDHSLGKWREAREKFSAVQARETLSTEDVLALGDSAWWLGFNDEALSSFETAFQQLMAANAEPEAAKLALGLGFLWLLRGEQAIGSGWISRGQQLLERLPDCVEQGYGRALEAENALATGSFSESIALAQEVQSFGNRFQDPNLTVIGLFGEGVGRIRSGEIARGMSLLDQAMIGVAAGTVDADWAGNLYCQMMGICSELADFGRAIRWTDATERWCNRFTSAVMFWGVCRLHRSQLLQLGGDWSGAEAEAHQVVKDLADMNIGAVAESHYQVGEINRLRGAYSRAEAAFKLARELGRDPQPGLALLRLAQGRLDGAAAGVSASLAATRDDFVRFRLRGAQIEVCLAREDLTGATEALHEVERIAGTYPSPGLEAGAWQSSGAVRSSQLLPLPERLPQFDESLPMLAEGRYTKNHDFVHRLKYAFAPGLHGKFWLGRSVALNPVGGLIRNHSQLLHQAEIISHRPPFNGLAVVESKRSARKTA
ncbi:MAG: hypothetical protein ACRDVK_11530 [Acidimicrobiia bacterium]